MFNVSRSPLVFLLLLVGGLACLAAPASAARGWAKVQNGSLVTADGELLRGIFFDPDQTGAAGMPSEAEIRLMKEYGFNTLHVYGEHPCPSMGLVGGTVKVNEIDTLVQYTKNNDLYMVLTIGQLCSNDLTRTPLAPSFNTVNCNMKDSQDRDIKCDYEIKTYDKSFATAFWSKYAKKYKNETHLIFELINEPWWIRHDDIAPLSGEQTVHSQGYPTTVIDDQASVYTTVRKAAPKTPILLFSYGGFNNIKAPEQTCCATVLADWNAVDNKLTQFQLRPTTKDAIAFHTYGSGTINSIKTVTTTVRNQGLAIINTEVERDASQAACGFVHNGNQACLREEQHETYEKEEISWLSFLKARQELSTGADWDKRVKDQLEFGSSAPPALIWPPDDSLADWPVQNVSSSFCGMGLHLKWTTNGKWVKPGNDNMLRANHSSTSTLTQFTVICRPSGKVWLKARRNQKYVDPGISSTSSALAATVTNPGTQHEFDLFKRQDGTLILRSAYLSGHPRWRIVAGNTNSLKLFDNQTQFVSNARFTYQIQNPPL